MKVLLAAVSVVGGKAFGDAISPDAVPADRTSLASSITEAVEGG